VTMLLPPVAQGPVVTPAAWAAAAKAKAKRDRESYRAFRAADQAEHEWAHRERVASAVAAAESDVAAWREDVETGEPAAAEALATARAAEDRARRARDYAREQRAELERVEGKSSVEEETDARVRADSASETARHAAEEAEAAAEASRQADRYLAEAREGLAGAERELEEAKQRAAVPAGTAPISDVTVRACAAYMQCDEVWDQLAKQDRDRVRLAGRPRDLMSDREFWAMMRGE
jgi:hypothetical protein